MASNALLYPENHPQHRSAIASADMRPFIPVGSSPRVTDAGRTGSSADAVSILEDVRHAIQWNPAGARAAALRLVALLTPPADAPSPGSRGGLAPWQLRRIERYIREHLEHPIRLEELAEQVSLSVSHFCRAFKESFGDTPHAHIIQMRLTFAKELMLATRDPLSEIALACGFANQAHLSKLFRHKVGETPNAWRRRNLTDAQAAPRGDRSPGARAEDPAVSLARSFGCRPKEQAA
jgi:AraC family transcriptional regulator